MWASRSAGFTLPSARRAQRRRRRPSLKAWHRSTSFAAFFSSSIRACSAAFSASILSLSAFSIPDKKVVKSVRGPNGKLDPVIGIVAVHPWIASSIGTSSTIENMGYLRIASICASGTAYIWELQVSFHPSGKVDSLKIRSPLVKLDLYRAMRQTLSFSYNKIDMFKVKFDADRDLLYWPFQSGSNGKTYVLVWDWNEDSIRRTSQKRVVTTSNKATSKAPETPLYRPSNIIEVPMLEEGGHHPMFSNVVAGLLHPSFSDLSVMILVVSDNGDMYIAGGQRRDGHQKNITIEEGVVYYKFILSSLKNSANVKGLGYLPFAENGKFKVSSATISRSRPDIVILNTSVGLLIMNLLLDEETLLTGSHHVSFPFGRGNGLITVKHSTVYASLNDEKNSLSWNGKVIQENTIFVYESPPPVHKTLEFQSRPVRIPPRMLPSPSGNFLCLFWHQENRYEILHMDRIADAVRKSQRDTDVSRLSPAVDTGFDVLSFAWIGDDDVFALLCPPELTKDTNNQIKRAKPVLNGLGSPRLVTQDEGGSTVANDPAKFKPNVELKMLVGVNADASEFSSSLAAATAKSLGTITLRGRHAPSCLFGGPMLCVRGLLQDEDTQQKDGISHFYCLPSSATDNQASSYVSIGPALPYPDLVVWDDEGNLCAFIVERRVAIYKAKAPNFTLCGTAYLGTDNDTESKVQSAKFILGVLYCSTEKSIQSILLGDIDNDEVICETDSFIIASSKSIVIPVCKYSIYPAVQQISLMWPSVLCYSQGSLLISSTNGLHRISMGAPLFRIGALLSAGQKHQAQKWIDSIHPSQHEYLANFLFRRGFPDLAITLSGISIRTLIELCERYNMEEYLATLDKSVNKYRLYCK